MPGPPSRSGSRAGATLAAALTLSAWLAAAVTGCRTRVSSATEDAGAAHPAAGPTAPGDRSASGTRPVKILYPAAPGSFVDLVAAAAPSIVTIRSTAPVKNGPASLYPGAIPDDAVGTGFLVDSDGHIVTSDRVIAAAREPRVVLADGTVLPAKVIGRDARLDVALLKIDLGGPAGPAAALRPLPLGDSADLAIGEWVIALGNPAGIEVTASAGIIGGRGLASPEALVGAAGIGYRGFLQTDAAIHAGNAGGPLLDVSGNVVGVCSPADPRGGPLGFAAPIDKVKEILPQLRRDGAVSRAWLGLYVQPVTAALAGELGLPGPAGALVSDVVSPGPGARAGLRRGDVILQFDGREVDDKSLPWIAATAPIGKPIDIVVWRDRASTHLAAVTEKMPE
jgi:serine protease Do